MNRLHIMVQDIRRSIEDHSKGSKFPTKIRDQYFNLDRPTQRTNRPNRFGEVRSTTIGQIVPGDRGETTYSDPIFHCLGHPFGVPLHLQGWAPDARLHRNHSSGYRSFPESESLPFLGETSPRFGQRAPVRIPYGVPFHPGWLTF
jgi:hypothetical protein